MAVVSQSVFLFNEPTTDLMLRDGESAGRWEGHDAGWKQREDTCTASASDDNSGAATLLPFACPLSCRSLLDSFSNETFIKSLLGFWFDLAPVYLPKDPLLQEPAAEGPDDPAPPLLLSPPLRQQQQHWDKWAETGWCMSALPWLFAEVFYVYR